VRLVGFIIRIYHSARSAELQMHMYEVYLSCIIYYVHVSVAVATIIRVPSQQH